MKRFLAAFTAAGVLSLCGCGSGGRSSGGSTTAQSFRQMTSGTDTSASAGAVKGTVRSTSGTVAVGAAVTVTAASGGSAGSFTTATDANGQFAVGNMPPGQYKVRVEESGTGTVDFTVLVTAGQVTDHGPCGLQHGGNDGIGGGDVNGGVSATTGVIVGDVVDSAGAPVAGATVDAGNNHVGRTNRAGLFAIGGLAAGSYTVKIQAFGFADASQAATVTAGTSTLLQFTLTAGTGTGTAAPATLNVTVTDAATQLPLAGASLTLGDSAAVTTKADGTYAFTNLKAGGYLLAVTATGYHEAKLPVRAEPGATVALPVTLTPESGAATGTGTLVLTVTDKTTAAAVSPAMVRLDDYRPFFVDANGKVTVTSVPAGSHNLVVQARGYAAVNDVVTITADQTTTVAESLTARATGAVEDGHDGGLVPGPGEHERP